MNENVVNCYRHWAESNIKYQNTFSAIALIWWFLFWQYHTNTCTCIHQTEGKNLSSCDLKILLICNINHLNISSVSFECNHIEFKQGKWFCFDFSFIYFCLCLYWTTNVSYGIVVKRAIEICTVFIICETALPLRVYECTYGFMFMSTVDWFTQYYEIGNPCFENNEIRNLGTVV